MKLFYSNQPTVYKEIIHPDELNPGEVGKIVCWFEKGSDLVGYYIEGGFGFNCTIASTKERLLSAWTSSSISTMSLYPRHLYKVEVER